VGRPSFYHQPLHYEIAFNWRDVKSECAFLTQCSETFGGGKPQRFLELACGPGFHLAEMASRGVDSTGVELSEPMAAHTRQKLTTLGLATRARVELADMRSFNVATPVDLAFTAINSFAYLLTLDDVLKHLECMARAVRPKGVYVIELTHPKKYFMGDESITQDQWTAERDGTHIDMQWDCGKHREIDALTQVATIRWQYDATQNGKKQRFTGSEKMRVMTAQEIVAAVRLCGQFEIMDWRGAMSWKVPFTNEKRSWRMIPILRRLWHVPPHPAEHGAGVAGPDRAAPLLREMPGSHGRGRPPGQSGVRPRLSPSPHPVGPHH
jgi:cyclopropane fatty-acyl-phospholipid synthase-like methyltransferase